MPLAFTTRQIAGKNSVFLPDQKLKFNGKTLDLSTPLVMGILNLTPDSFYKQSRIKHTDQLIEQAGKMLEEGAHCLDLGASSTRPGSKPVSLHQEAERLIAPLKLLHKTFPNTWISVDTFRASIAQKAIKSGASMINDISGGTFDEKMLDLISSEQVPYVLMHLEGTYDTMHNLTIDASSIVDEVKRFFEKQTEMFLRRNAHQLILDPGFGFSKTLEANFKLLNSLDEINPGNFPLLVGVSRKSMIRKVLDIAPEDALNGTTVLHTLALQQGAAILRTHDVKEAVQCIKLLQFTKSAAN